MKVQMLSRNFPYKTHKSIRFHRILYTLQKPDSLNAPNILLQGTENEGKLSKSFIKQPKYRHLKFDRQHKNENIGEYYAVLPDLYILLSCF